MKLVFFVVVLFYGSLCIHCSNVDTKFPIIYSRPVQSLPGRNSYFGFSLLLNNTWVQIGAPRANSTILGNRVMEPGVVYRCKIFGTCTEVELDRNVNRLRDDNVLVWDLKNYSWIGGAMDMERGPQGKVVICGHRWKNQQDLSPQSEKGENMSDIYAISGICYFSQYETEFIPKFKYNLPPEAYDREGIKHGPYHYPALYHKSQIGMSVYIAPPSKDGVSLLIGAPGAGRYWSGGVLEYISKPKKDIAARRRRDVSRNNFEPFSNSRFIDGFTLPIDQFDYFGYQVAAGYFFSKTDLMHVGSAPRANDLKGLVAIYAFRGIRVDLIDFIEGQSYGEYFGSSLAVADVTGDGFDDLIIGAPFFSIHGDEGCIYVFTKPVTNQYTIQKFQEKEKITGFSIGGRFGTSVASLGDIDQDGNEDIAVGAPYEESGVIYIFNGVPSGLSSKHSQRIAARDIHHSIRGFGISISRPADIDGNKFSDIAIGSYLSQHVIILRSYPVIDLHSYISSNTKQFYMNQTGFTVEACLYYKGSKNVPNNIEVVRMVDVDNKFRRFHSVPEKSFVLVKRTSFHCENITLQKKKESDIKFDDLSDIVIVLSQRLKHRENNESVVLWVNGSSVVQETDKFCHSCPVVGQTYFHDINIPYARDCGKDGVCESDAQLSCQLLQNDIPLKTSQQPFLGYDYIIGTSPNLKLILDVHNKGDTLYSPKVKIYIPEQVELAQMSLMCQEKKNISLEISCGFRSINNGNMRSDNISLDLSSYETLRKMSEDGLPLFIKAIIPQENYKDFNPSNNDCNIKLNLIMEADVNITGISKRDEFFSKSDRKTSNFIHIYEVLNVGISPLRQVQTFFHIPVEWLGSGSPIQISSPAVEAQQNGKTVFCNPAKANMTTGQFIDNSVMPGVKSKKNKGVSMSDNHPSNRTFYVNCSSSNVKCKTWLCNFLEFKNNTITKITIAVQFNVSNLVPVIGNKDIISFSSHGHVTMVESNNTQRPDIMTHHDTTVSSFAIGKVTDEKIALWIIILCIIAGILLIAAIVVGLAKAGFFKRGKKEELQALKESEN